MTALGNPYAQPRTRQRLGVAGCWTAPCAAPIVWGILGQSPVAVKVGEATVTRLAADPFTGAPAETTDAMLMRAAMTHGTAQPFELIYA
jgi:hypothetical protein